MPTPRRGRPRSEQVRSAVLDAARDLLAELGYDQVTVAGIAAKAGVSKQTVYRWWRSKAAIVAEGVLEGVVALAPVTIEASGNFERDLTGWLTRSFDYIEATGSAPLLRGLAAAAASDEEAAAGMAERFTVPLRAAVASSLQAGIRSGTVRADVRAEAVSDLLLGVFLYAIASRDSGAADRVADVVETALHGVHARPS